MIVKAEGGVEEAALLRPGVVGPLAPLELLLACVRVAGLRRRAGFSPKMRIGCDIVSRSLPFWHDSEGLASYLSNPIARQINTHSRSERRNLLVSLRTCPDHGPRLR